MLEANVRQQLLDDSVVPALSAETRILDSFEAYAESTGRTKMTPEEPSPRDLGRLREPIGKAEKTIRGESDSADTGNVGDACDESTTQNIPQRTAAGDEHKAVALAVDGLSLLFGQDDDDYKKLNTTETSVDPIGYRLSQHRATQHDEMRQESFETSTILLILSTFVVVDW